MHAYGILKQSNLDGFWDINNIKSIFGTSSGSMLGFIIALKYSWDVIDDYIIKRPWQNVFRFDIEYIIQSYSHKGIFNVKIIEDFCIPLLKAKNLDINTTMMELYQHTGIDLHLFTTELHSYESIDISYKTYPEWRIIDAIYCSACLPIVFIPCCIDNKYYSDGGITNNYPIRSCIDNGAIANEIFGIELSKNPDKNEKITEDSSLFDYITCLINNMYAKMNKLQNMLQTIKDNQEIQTQIDIPYEIELYNDFAQTLNENNNNMSFYYIIEIAGSSEKREELINNGIKLWDDYYKPIFIK